MAATDDKKGDPFARRRSSVASSLSSSSTSSSVSQSAISLYDVNFDLRTPGATPAGSRRASHEALQRRPTRRTSVASWSQGPDSNPQIIGSDRISSITLRRIGPKDLAIYEEYAYFQQRPRLPYTDVDIGTPESLPILASKFMIDFVIKRSTGDLHRSVRLSHCSFSYSDRNVKPVLEQCQLRLSQAKRIALPAGVKLDNVTFSFGLQHTHAFHAFLSVEDKTIDDRQAIAEARVVAFTFTQNHQSKKYFLSAIDVVGRKAQLGVQVFRCSPTSIDITALPTDIGDMGDNERASWLGPQVDHGKRKIYTDWVIRNLQFSYSGEVIGGTLVRINPLVKIRPQKEFAEKERSHGLFGRRSKKAGRV